MGMGHLYRVQKIVDKLREHSLVNITLFTQNFDQARGIYKEIAFDEVIEIEPSIDEKQEILLLEQLFAKKQYDICLNDQLNSSKEVATILTKNSKRSITLDDLGEGNSLFDWVINILYPSDKQMKNEINSYKYMILNNFLSIKNQIEFSAEVKTIFINQGAADTWGAIPHMIKDLNKLDLDITIKVLLGPSFEHFQELGEALKVNKKQIEIFNFTNNVVELVKDCDLAILGAGNTLFEVASLGIPIIASTREEKELITIQRLLDDHIVYAENKLYVDGLETIVKSTINNTKDREEKFEKNRALFNYNGLNKIIELLVGDIK